MLEKIYNWILSIFNKSNIYWDEYGIYDADTGLMLEYYAPDDVEVKKESIFPLQTNILQGRICKALEKDFSENISNFSENIANEMAYKSTRK